MVVHWQYDHSNGCAYCGSGPDPKDKPPIMEIHDRGFGIFDQTYLSGDFRIFGLTLEQVKHAIDYHQYMVHCDELEK